MNATLDLKLETFLGRLAPFALAALVLLPAQAAETNSIKLEVDAREIQRRLVHAREEIPVHPGKLALWYPKWIPGTHAPCGPVENIGGLFLETPDGKPIAWQRDGAEPCRIECTIPAGMNRLIIRIDYICNQPSVNSEGVDCFGNSKLGVMSWNTCLFYPEDASIDELTAGVKLLLPPKWRIGTALTVARETNSLFEFKSASLRNLVDCPLICGEYLRTIDLNPEKFPTVVMHVVSESQAAVQVDEKMIGKFRKLVQEASRLYGGAHFTNYHFLCTCSDQAGGAGVEHLSSSMDQMGERSLIDEGAFEGDADLLPHEFTHSWCGKHKRPAGMVTTNFHTPERTSLLWVYEGLTEYLGGVLSVRSGLVSTNDFLAGFTGTIDGLMHTAGRQWRPLEDTATANYTLRGHSPNWGSWRRSQDYYPEGALLWLEADAIIRQESDGHKSLDDFCKKFLGPDGRDKIVPYERADVIKALNDITPYDWATFIHDRVDVTQTDLPLTVLERCGYRLQYSPEPPKGHRGSASDTLGMSIDGSGRVSSVTPGMPGDQAGFAPGMTVVGVNNIKFSSDHLKDAIADSVEKRHIDFLMLDGDTYRTITIKYADGLKYLQLVRDKTKPDLLSAILKPAGKESE